MEIKEVTQPVERTFTFKVTWNELTVLAVAVGHSKPDDVAKYAGMPRSQSDPLLTGMYETICSAMRS